MTINGLMLRAHCTLACRQGASGAQVAALVPVEWQVSTLSLAGPRRPAPAGGGVLTSRGSRLRQLHHDLHVIDGEESRLAMYRALEPVLVDARCQCNHVAFLEAQFAFILGLKVV